MAIYYARKAGNVNATDVWATTQGGTASDLFPSFTSADTLMSNSFTVTLNVNTTVAEVRNDNTGGATAGGNFALSNGVILTANVICGANASCVTFSLASPNSASIVGNISNAANSLQSAATNGSSGTLNITGNCTGGPANLTNGVSNSSSGTVNITGICTGGSNNAHGAYNSSIGTINIVGSAVGGPASNSFGAQNVSIGTINIIGTATGSSIAIGANNNSTGTMTVTRAKGNGFGNGSVGLSAVVGVNAAQNSATRVYEIEYGDLGMSPTSGPIILLDDTSNVALFYRTSGGKKTLIDSSASAGHPAITNVRSGISYANGNLTGTCAVPSAGSVALGVAVDNTTGTAILTQADVETALASFSSGRLSNCATVASVGQQIIMLAEA